MIDASFRSFFSKKSRAFIKFMARTGLSPNSVTVLAFIISSSAAIAIYKNQYFLALLLWWSGRLLDATDGELARNTGKTSAFGAFLDITLDMTAYSLIIVGFYFKELQHQAYWMMILFLYIGCITSALALGTLLNQENHANHDNRGLRLASGLAEGGETGLAYTAFLLFPGSLPYLLPVWILILFITIAARFLFAYRTAGQRR